MKKCKVISGESFDYTMQANGAKLIQNNKTKNNIGRISKTRWSKFKEEVMVKIFQTGDDIRRKQ